MRDIGDAETVVAGGELEVSCLNAGLADRREGIAIFIRGVAKTVRFPSEDTGLLRDFYVLEIALADIRSIARHANPFHIFIVGPNCGSGAIGVCKTAHVQSNRDADRRVTLSAWAGRFDWRKPMRPITPEKTPKISMSDMVLKYILLA